MKRLLETIKIQDGIIQNIIYHNQRFNKTRRHFWPNAIAIDLYEYITIPKEYKKGTVRCRILYNKDIEEVQFFEYQKKSISVIKLVLSEIDYSFKYEDRTELDNLIAQNSDFDDILIVKNGLITDTSYANIVLKKDREYYTPKKPLLNGTKRQHLIDEDIIIQKSIKLSDLGHYSSFALINAFNDLDLSNFVSIKNIIR